jgi:hypothetical protein
MSKEGPLLKMVKLVENTKHQGEMYDFQLSNAQVDIVQAIAEKEPSFHLLPEREREKIGESAFYEWVGNDIIKMNSPVRQMFLKELFAKISRMWSAEIHDAIILSIHGVLPVEEPMTDDEIKGPCHCGKPEFCFAIQCVVARAKQYKEKAHEDK